MDDFGYRGRGVLGGKLRFGIAALAIGTAAVTGAYLTRPKTYEWTYTAEQHGIPVNSRQVGQEFDREIPGTPPRKSEHVKVGEYRIHVYRRIGNKDQKSGDRTFIAVVRDIVSYMPNNSPTNFFERVELTDKNGNGNFSLYEGDVLKFSSSNAMFHDMLCNGVREAIIDPVAYRGLFSTGLGAWYKGERYNFRGNETPREEEGARAVAQCFDLANLSGTEFPVFAKTGEEELQRRLKEKSR